ncbi:MAG TPA: hypothetical protein VJ508_16680 [Saprospiraceae bacterium]|nr:hypothetical protein [Saprospiraceae bacterium]
MLKYTKHNLNKLEELFRELKVTIRYEKGNFQSGYCIVSGKNMVIVNRFFDVEARINVLMEILDSGQLALDDLTEEQVEWYHKMKKSLAHPV